MSSLAFKIGDKYEIGYDVGEAAKVFKEFSFKDAQIGHIISALLPIIYLIAGLILFGAIIFSGFNLLVSGGDEKKTAEAKGCLTNAIVGFVIIFVSWWLVQILEIIFGIPILKP